METKFSGDRHERRLNKIDSHASEVDGTPIYERVIPEIYELIKKEDQRQKREY